MIETRDPIMGPNQPQGPLKTECRHEHADQQQCSWCLGPVTPANGLMVRDAAGAVHFLHDRPCVQHLREFLGRKERN